MVFNVLLYDFNTRDVEIYNVVPYFVREWEAGSFEKNKIKTKDDFREWVLRAARYHYWARCEYEVLIAPWPFGSYQTKQRLKELEGKSVEEHFIDYMNACCEDMVKIDIYDQIEMNIDIFVDLLWNEFFGSN